MKLFRLLFLFSVLVINSFRVHGQDVFFFQLPGNELSNAEIYTLLFDETESLLYAGSNQGLHVYKNGEFREIKLPDEALGSAFFQLVQNNGGSIYCSNLKGQFFKIEGDSCRIIHHIDNTSKFNYILKSPQGNISIINGNAILSIDQDTVKSRHESSKIIFDPLFINDTTIISSTSEGFDKIITLQKNGNTSEKIVRTNKSTTYSSYFMLGEEIFKSEKSGRIQGVENDLIIPQLDDQHSPIRIDENTVFLASPKSGFRTLRSFGDEIQISPPFLSKVFISAMAQSSDGTVFCGTFDRGVLVVNTKLNKYYFNNELLLGIAVDQNGNVNVSSRSRKLYEFENYVPRLKFKTTSHLDYLFYPRNLIANKITGVTGLFYADSSSIFGATANFKTTTEVSDSALLVSDGNTLRKLSLNPNGEIRLEKFPNKNFISLGQSSVGRQYASTKTETGFLTKGYNLNPLKFNQRSFTSRTITANKSVVFFGTSTLGVLFFQNDSCIKQLSTEDGLSSNKIKRIEVEDEKLFILTYKGVHIYDLSTDKLLTLGLSEGVQENQTTNLTFNGSELWLLEREAALNLDLSNIDYQRKSGKLVLDSVTFNGQSPLSGLQNLHHSTISFGIHYDYRDILGISETKVYYRLNGLSEEWKTQEADKYFIEYNGLAPGKYSFEIKTLYRGQEANHHEIDFRILPPIYLRWWFIVIFILCIVSLLWYLIKKRIQRIEHDSSVILLQERLKKKGLELNLKVLRAQMNPHFIFNSINSIQDLILKEETMKSYDYLVVFSKLVRQILDFSEQDFVTIREELKFLTDYLELEKLRFKDDFAYEITNVNCPEEKRIPSLAIQPLIENAIKHGLMHREGKKDLKIIFEIENGLTICKVIDNGIGIEESKKINSRRHSHKSFSTKAIEKRLSLLSNQLQNEIKFELNEIKVKGETLGTEAIICFPENI